MAPSGFAGFRPMRHIDRKDLYTNLEARIQYLHTFLDFGSSELPCLPAQTRRISLTGAR